MDTRHTEEMASLGPSPWSGDRPPAASEHRDPRWLRPAQGVVLVGALCIIAVGVAAGAIGILVAVLGATGDILPVVTMSTAFLALCVALGAAIAWQSFRALHRRASKPFLPTRVRLLVVCYALAILGGQFVLSRELLTPLTFPPFHAAATVLPPLIVLWLVGRALPGTTRWRDIDLQVGSGAFLSTTLAFVLELAVLVGAVVVLLTVVMIMPGGLDQIEAFLGHMSDPDWLQDPSGWASLALSPVVVTLALLLAAVAIPIIEEAVKTVGVGLAFYRRPGLAEAFLWGLACGVGFSLAEGMLNTTAALEGWAAVVLLRVGATMLHCVTGGLMGIAWFSLVAQRRWLHGLALYVASVIIHGTWNALTVGMALASLSSSAGGSTGMSTRLADTGTALAITLLLGLSLVSGLGLAGLTRYARHQSRKHIVCTDAGGQRAEGHSATPDTDSRAPLVNERYDG